VKTQTHHVHRMIGVKKKLCSVNIHSSSEYCGNFKGIQSLSDVPTS
jgi:hypothetical protein